MQIVKLYFVEKPKKEKHTHYFTIQYFFQMFARVVFLYLGVEECHI